MLTFKQFLNEAPTLAQIVHGLGKNSGIEHAAFRNTQTRQDSPILVGTKKSVDVDKLHPDLNNIQPHVMVHSHPKDGALSVGDARYLVTTPQMKTMHAVTPSGSLYSAKVTPMGARVSQVGEGEDKPILRGIRRASDSIYKNVLQNSKLNKQEQSHIQGHIIHTALHHLGVINYKPFMKGKDKIITDKHRDLIDSQVEGAKKNIMLDIRKHI